MKVLRSFGPWILVGMVGLACAVQAQNSQGNGQQGNSNNGTAPTTNNNVPYNPPAPPPGGYGDAGTGAYTGRGSTGYGSSSGQTGGSGGYGMGQTGSSGIGRVNPTDLGVSDVPLNQQQMEEQQAKARNTERQKQLVADTQKLVALANELQTEVGKSTKDTLSLDVIRKADEIEKLAKTVRERMKNAN